MNKTVLIKSYFAAVGKDVTVEKPTGETGLNKTGIFGKLKLILQRLYSSPIV